MPGSVVIVNYNPDWPRLFEEEKALVLNAIGKYIDEIHHIGSTSVPGLGAKPIIDIMIGIRKLLLVDKCVQPLQGLGYEYLGEYGIPGRHYFRKPVVALPAHRTHHIHMTEMTYDGWRRNILFRDYLRSHPEDAKEYELLKRALAKQFGTNRQGYTNAKAEFIEAVLDKATVGG